MYAFILIALISFVCVATSRVEAQAVRTITLNDAVQIGLEQDIELKKAKNRLELQRVAVRQERANFFPNLSLSATPGANFGLSFNQTTGRLDNDRTESLNFGLNSGINIFNGFRDVASLKRENLNLDAEEMLNSRASQNVIQGVIFNFLQVILNAEQIRIQQENLESQNQLLARIEEFTRVGTRPISDLYQQQSQVAQNELQLINAERDYQISQSRLIQILQLSPFEDYDFVAPSTEEIALIPQSYDLNQLMQTAFEQRPDLQSDRYQLDASQETIRIAKGGRLPSVNLNVGWGTGYTSANSFLNFSDQLDANRGSSMRMSFSIPIFDRYQSKLGIEQAEVQYNNARLDLQNREQAIAIEVRQVYLDYQTDIKRLDATEKQVTAAEQALEAEQERYNVGASTLVELSQARATYVQALSDRAQAVYQFVLRDRLIDHATGTLDPGQTMFE